MTTTKITDSHKIRIRKYQTKGMDANKIRKKYFPQYARQQIAAIMAWKTIRGE